MTTRRITLIVLTLLAAPIVAATVATALMWCVHQWNWPLWVVATVGGGSFLALMFAAWRFNRRMVDRQFRFSIREMFVGVAAIALFVGTFGRWWLRFSHELGALSTVYASGGYVYDGRGHLGRPTNGLYPWVGYDPFDSEHTLVITSNSALQDVLRRPDNFVNTAQLSFYRGVSSAAFKHAEELNRLPNLRELYKVRIGHEMLQSSYYDYWNMWIVDKEQEVQLLKLITTQNNH